MYVLPAHVGTGRLEGGGREEKQRELGRGGEEEAEKVGWVLGG